MYKCKHCEFFSTTVSETANHTRWKHYKEDTSNKFLRYVCCINCRNELTIQNFSSHLESHSQANTIKGSCLQCGCELYKSTKFCSKSCSAKYTNIRKDYTKFKPGPRSGLTPKYTKVKQCSICMKFHPRTGLTCSDTCYSKSVSIKTNQRIEDGWNPQENRCRSKPSYLEKSFESWLVSMNYTNYIKNKTFRCGKKIYFGDFYFPSKRILIELDGKQHLESIEYDELRDKLIKEHFNVETIRISYQEYISKSKIDTVLNMIR